VYVLLVPKPFKLEGGIKHMSRVSFLFRTDVHLSDRSPMSWKGDYSAEIFSDLEQIGELAKKHQVNAVLDGGDYFHVKAPAKNPHHLNERSARIHRAYPCPTYCIEGNHDLAYNNLESLAKQPLGVLYASGIFNHLREQVFEDGDLRVRVIGVPYSPNRTLADLLSIQKKKGDTHLLAVVHALASKNPPTSVEDFWNEPVFSYDSLVSPNGPDVFMFGHWHKDQGIEIIGGKQFVNQGAVSRGSLVRENLERTPRVALIEIDDSGLQVTPIELSVFPASEVFDLEKKALQERERHDIDQFITRLLSEGTVDPDASIEDNVRSLDFADDVRSEALRYLEMAELASQQGLRTEPAIRN
jgi:exonuclease SbcD